MIEKYKTITPPWSEEQIYYLKLRQACPIMHPYTCTCGADLIPTVNGWVCDKCEYTQDWCLHGCLEAGKELSDPESEFNKTIKVYLGGES